MMGRKKGGADVLPRHGDGKDNGGRKDNSDIKRMEFPLVNGLHSPL